MKLEVLVAVAAGDATEIRPVLAPSGTFAEIVVSEITVKVALLLANLTAVALARPIPVMVTTAPTGPLAGANPVIDGGTTTVNVGLVAIPPGVVTEICPVGAPGGTTVSTCLGDFTVNEAVTPLNLTLVVPERLFPLIATGVPTGPLIGVIVVIAGAGPTVTVNIVALVAVPSAVVTASGPVTAPVGTVVVICVAELTM